ncbi:MAG: PilZ domain-containing protein [Planctomycetota bacterium]|nr:PilZ domain-containing protein [Planctomycetota bacterium]
MEKRKHKRVSLVFPLRICIAEIEQIACREAVDLSEGGLFVRMTTPPRIGARVNLEFSLPTSDKPVQAEGRVVRAISKQSKDGTPPGVGIQFYMLGNEARETIQGAVGELRNDRHSQIIELPGGFLEAVDREIQENLPAGAAETEIGIDLEVRVRFPEDDGFSGAAAHTLPNEEIFIRSDLLRPMGTRLSLEARIEGTNEWVVGEGVIVRAIYSSGSAQTPAGPGIAVGLTPSSAELRSYVQSLLPRVKDSSSTNQNS